MTGGRFTPDMLTALLQDPLEPAYAEAAERRKTRRPEPAWLRRTGRTASVLTVALIGFLLSVGYQQVIAGQPESNRIRAGLMEEIRSRQAMTDELQRRAERLRSEVDRQREETLTGGEAAALRNLAAAAGLGRVRGDGVIVQLADAPPQVDPVTGQPRPDNLGTVLDRDLQAVVNALWSLGAEAVAIDGQRLSATSTIRAAGAAILVDFKPVTNPYQVAAIGPGDLDKRFNQSATGEQFRALSRRYGMGLQVHKQADLTLPAATDPQLRYAHPPGVPSQSPSPTSGGR